MNEDRRIHKSKKALKDAMTSLMKKKDIKSITITEIVSLADLNRGTFYKHYQYKEELLNDIIDDVISDLAKSYREPYLDTNKFSINDLSISAIKIFEHVATYSDFYTIIINSNVLPDLQNKICEVIKQISIQDLFSVNENNAINTELYASFHAYALVGMIIEWVRGNFQYTPKYMAEQLIQIISVRPQNAVFNTFH